jgi:hypothetical protein
VPTVNTNSNNGIYDVTWTTAHPNGSTYAIFGNSRNANGVLNYTVSSQSATSLRVTTYNLTGTQFAADFNIMTYP